MRYCFGAFISVLTICSPRATTQKKLCGTILNAVNSNYDITEDDATCSHLKGCTVELSPDILDEFGSASPEFVSNCFQTQIIPSLYSEQLKAIAEALIEIILSDDGIADSTEIGVLNVRRKDQMKNPMDYNLAELLTDLLWFSFTLRNDRGRETIKDINKKYIQKADEQNRVKLLSKIKAPATEISQTVKKKNFDTVFEEISADTLGLANADDLRMYRFRMENYEFSYLDLQKFLAKNIGTYLYSRSRIEKFKSDDDEDMIAYEAARFLREHRTGNELGELLLYAFLEVVLQAPKILSRVELSGTPCYDGVHLNLLGDGGASYQMVFGTSEIEGDLTAAIDHAFDKIVRIRKEKPDLLSMIESPALNCEFDDEAMLDLVKNIIVPQKSGQQFPDTAFGIFLGYTIQIDDDDYELPSADFNKKIIKIMEDDLRKKMPYILSKIKTLHLGMHSFYIYLVPFNQADRDKDEIVKRLLIG